MLANVDKTILLTGGTGFLGSYLLKYLLNQHYHIILLKRSFSDTTRIQAELENIIFYNINHIDLELPFKNHSIDMIIHCATDYGRKTINPVQLVQANLTLPLMLIQFAVQYKIPVFINTDTILDKRISDYSLSKKQFLEWLKTEFSKKLICINLLLEHFYGPGDDPSKFLTYMINNLLQKVSYINLTPGEQKRDFIFIEDVISAFSYIIQTLSSYSVGFYEYQIGSGEAISIKTLLQKIQCYTENSETQLQFGAYPYRENEVMISTVDLTAIKQLGWRPLTTLDEGLMKTITFEKKYYKVTL